MNRKRFLELGSGFILFLVVAGLVGGWLYFKSLNDALVRLMETPGLDRHQRASVHRILRKGARIQTQRSDGYNLLMLAARNGDRILLRQALQRGLAVNSECTQGWTPLTEAMASGDEECVRTLIAAGADVNHRDGLGRTPLMWAAQFRFRGGIRLLHAQGADFRARNAKGQSAVPYVGAQPGLIRLLKELGAPE